MISGIFLDERILEYLGTLQARISKSRNLKLPRTRTLTGFRFRILRV